MNHDIMGPVQTRPRPQAPAPARQPQEPRYQEYDEQPPAAHYAPPRRRGRKFLWTLLVLVLIAGAAGGVYYWQSQQVTDLNAKISDLQNTNNSLSGQVGSLNSQLSQNQSPKAETYSATLPNSKKISYPLSSTNSTVLWWYDQNATAKNNGNVLHLSSTKMVQFLSTVPTATLNKTCPNSKVDTFNAKSIELGTVDTTVNSLSFKAGDSKTCVEALQTDKTYGTDAKKTLEAAKADIDTFVKSLTIQ